MGEYPRESRDRLLIQVARLLAPLLHYSDEDVLTELIDEAEAELAADRAAEGEPNLG